MGCGSSQPVTSSHTSLGDRPGSNNNVKSTGPGQPVSNGHAASPGKENQNGAQVLQNNKPEHGSVE